MKATWSFHLRQWWSYYTKAKTFHQADSPFIYRFCDEVLESDSQESWFEKIEKVRKHLLKNKDRFVHTDFGAGPGAQGLQAPEPRIRDFIHRSAIRPKHGRILHRFTRFFKAKHILELGTAAGLSTAYLSSPDGPGQLITIEGDPLLAGLARQNFDALGIHPTLITGAFDQVLPGILNTNPVFDLIFIDGNHRGAALEYYVALLNKYLHPEHGVIILDDIHWSQDMADSWEKLRSDRQWNLSLDLYQFGLLIRNQDLLHPTSLNLIEWKWKPLNPGIFR